MTIAEVSKKYDFTPDTLRYYERIGLLTNIPRNKNGIRDYDEQSCKKIEFIKCMRNAGVEIEILIEYMTLLSDGNYVIGLQIEGKKIKKSSLLIDEELDILEDVNNLDFMNINYKIINKGINNELKTRKQRET